MLALTKKSEASPPSDDGEGSEDGDLQIDVYDSEGNLVPQNSPIIINEGASYTVVLTIKNTSTKGGVPWPVDFVVGMSAATDLTTLISPRENTYGFTAGETKAISYLMYVPMGSGGQTGLIQAYVAIGAGGAIASANAELTIGTVAINYGATIILS